MCFYFVGKQVEYFRRNKPIIIADVQSALCIRFKTNHKNTVLVNLEFAMIMQVMRVISYLEMVGFVVIVDGKGVAFHVD